MTTRDPEIDELLAPLRDGPIALSGAGDSEALRSRLMPDLRHAVRQAPVRARRARLRRRAGAFAGFAGVALIAFGLLRTPTDEVAQPLRIASLGSEPTTWIDADGARHALDLDASIEGLGELVAPDASSARVSTARGVRVELAARSRLRVTSERSSRDGGGLRLEHGEVHCRVPKLGAKDHFSISTPDAEVIVHGTVFSVRVGEPESPGTCVRVTDGLVEVRHQGQRTFLRTGTEWGCESAPRVPVAKLAAEPVIERSAAAARDVEASPARTFAERRASSRRGASPRTPPGTLAAENALLAAALAAERDSDRDRAHALFSTLLERHPRSPLAPEASAGFVRTR